MAFTHVILSEFEHLLGKLLEQKPELTDESVREMIAQKKEKIGAGYLTDQGALFLIASDLGVTLAEPLKVEMGLKDLYVGAREISLETRVMNLSMPKQYSRKDGTQFLLRTMTVYDNDSTASVKLWDEKANLPGIDELKPGDLVKIIKAYVKSDLGGMPTINVGSGASIESADGESNIPSIESITKDISEIEDGQKDLVVSGVIDGQISSIQFTNSRGQPGKGLKLGLKGRDGLSKGIVIWGKDESDIPAVVPPGAKARLLGVKTKTTDRGLEIHGNESTLIEIEGSQQTSPVIVRIISKTESDAGDVLLLGVDGQRNLLRLSDTSGIAAELQEDDVMECMPTKAHGNSITLDSGSFVRKLDDNKSIPTREEMRTKINQVGIGGRSYCIEAIVLKLPERRDVQTKTGESIALSEMFVEDDSGQIWVKGWKNQARIIDKCTLGEVVSITDLDARSGLDGRVDLFLSPFSKIIKKIP